jgi:thiol-disulfide isomerase/thioredoxin/uncharacterized membrane protein YphA (DoxX/SURF4 family)
MDIILLILRLVLFGVFTLAVVGKLLDLEGAQKAVKDFGVPDALATPAMWLLLLAEGAIGVLLLFSQTSWLGSTAALALLAIFLVGMLIQIRKGNGSECHCFGQIHSEPVSYKSLMRNAIFAVMALVLTVSGQDQGVNIMQAGTSAIQTVVLLLLLVIAVAIASYLKKIFTQQTLIMRRIEILELISNEGGSVDRAGAGDPNDGLPIGSPFPAFTLENASGEVVTLGSLLAGGTPAVMFFVSPTCEPCKALLPQISEWRGELGEKVNFVFVSSGSAQENLDKFGEFGPNVLIQNQREVADSVRAKWTPTAVLVRQDGTIGSHVFAGDKAIAELIDSVRNGDFSDRDVYFTNSSVQTLNTRIGESVPEFTLETAMGEPVSSSELRGKTTLAVFWSLTCPHCHAMIDELREWDLAKNGSDPDLIVFSDGAAEDLQDLGLRSPVVLDAGHKVSELLGMFGTPSAVLIDETGKIKSEAAVGSPNIWALVGKRK